MCVRNSPEGYYIFTTGMCTSDTGLRHRTVTERNNVGGAPDCEQGWKAGIWCSRVWRVCWKLMYHCISYLASLNFNYLFKIKNFIHIYTDHLHMHHI